MAPTTKRWLLIGLAIFVALWFWVALGPSVNR